MYVQKLETTDQNLKNVVGTWVMVNHRKAQIFRIFSFIFDQSTEQFSWLLDEKTAYSLTTNGHVLMYPVLNVCYLHLCVMIFDLDC